MTTGFLPLFMCSNSHNVRDKDWIELILPPNRDKDWIELMLPPNRDKDWIELILPPNDAEYPL